jgi:putative ergosteryl-3beta-O-L-aspartate hydrolase
MSTLSLPTLKSFSGERKPLKRLHTTNHPPVPEVDGVDGTSEESEQYDDDDQNPLHRSPRWILGARVAAIRSGASLGFSIFHYSDPRAPPPTKTIWLDSTLSKWRGRKLIAVDVFDPIPKSEQGPRMPDAKRLAVINFHGGGFFLGRGTDDRHWVGALNLSLDAIVFSVNYRLAPSYPFPTPVEDCADAILQICARAAEFKFDSVILSGFSAGGTLSLASWSLLNNPEGWGYELPCAAPSIDGFALFYPGLDWSIPRWKKRQTCEQPSLALASGLTDLIDASYIHPPRTIEERRDIRLSPGRMPDYLVDKLPPVHMCMCEHDMLRAEAHAFVERLRDRGREVTARVVEGERHAWDKPPPMWQKPSALVEYTAAIARIKGWLDGAGGGSSSSEGDLSDEKGAIPMGDSDVSS